MIGRSTISALKQKTGLPLNSRHFNQLEIPAPILMEKKKPVLTDKKVQFWVESFLVTHFGIFRLSKIRTKVSNTFLNLILLHSCEVSHRKLDGRK